MKIDQAFNVKISAKPLKWKKPQTNLHITVPPYYSITKVTNPTRWIAASHPTTPFKTLTAAKAAVQLHFDQQLRKMTDVKLVLVLTKKTDTTEAFMRKLVEHVAGLPLTGAAGSLITIPDKMMVAKEVIQYIVDNPTA